MRIQENGAHMWNAVYVDGVAKSIDTSTIEASAEFYLNVMKAPCPVCGYENLFETGIGKAMWELWSTDQ